MFHSLRQWLRRSLNSGFGPYHGTRAGDGVRRQCERCAANQVIHITWAKDRRLTEEQHLCEKCAPTFLYSVNAPDAKNDLSMVDLDADVPIEVEYVIISEIHDQQVLMLREANGIRRFPFVLGIFEATVIDRFLRSMPSPRPLTHDAWLATLTASGVQVTGACFNELHEHTYYTGLRLFRGEESYEVDMRPSDAIVTAMKAGAPILIRGRLLAEVISSGTALA